MTCEPLEKALEELAELLEGSPDEMIRLRAARAILEYAEKAMPQNRLEAVADALCARLGLDLEVA